MSFPKYLATTITLALCLSAAAASAAPPAGHRGDINGDGSINIADINCYINAALQEAAGEAPPICQAFPSDFVDLQCDGAINITDVQRVILIRLFALSSDVDIQALLMVADADFNGVADSCEYDNDNDGVADIEDNCVGVSNPGQEDIDGDGIGDACDADNCTGTVCPDTANACMVDVCVPETGLCGVPVPNGTGCDADGDGCTVGDACDAGTCIAGPAPDCTGQDDQCNTGVCASTGSDSYLCVKDPAPHEGAGCDDGLHCTEVDTCSAGACAGVAIICPDDGNECVTDVCVPATGLCGVPVANGTSCDADASGCTVADQCDAGTCIAGPAPDCSAEDDQCHLGTCSSTGAESYVCVKASGPKDGFACDDGLNCTHTDTCAGGTCAGAPVVCPDDGDPCTTDICVPATGACGTNAPNGTPCDDGEACTLPDLCTAGVCGSTTVPECEDPQAGLVCLLSGNAGELVNCDINIARTAQGDEPAVGIQMALSYDVGATLVRFQDGEMCFPGFGCTPWTIPDTAQSLQSGHTVSLKPADLSNWQGSGSLLLSNLANPSTPLSDAYFAGPTIVNDPFLITATFELSTNVSVNDPIKVYASGLVASDKYALTQSVDTFYMVLRTSPVEPPCVSDAACAASMTVPPCKAAKCFTGVCILEDAPNGGACDDGDTCTTSDTCTAGVCAGTAIPGCVAGCGDSTCQANESCETCPADCGECPECFGDDDCVDFDACTTDTCDPGVGCVFTPISCDDADACSADSCDPVTGCANAPVSCNDGDACTADSCDPVTGCDNVAISCDDGTVCTVDSCNPATGCDNAPISCDDGSVCTADFCHPVTGCENVATDCGDGDACTTDSCHPVTGCANAPVTCDDDDPCTADSCDVVLGCVFTPSCAGPGVLVINEVDYDQPGTDTTEFIEIYNPGPGAADLTRWKVEHINGAGGTLIWSVNLSSGGASLPEGGYLVIGAQVVLDAVPTGVLKVLLPVGALQNGAPDGARLMLDNAFFGGISWEGTMPGTGEGTSAGEDPSTGVGSLSRCPNGVDTHDNGADFLPITDTVTPGAANACPEVPTTFADVSPIYQTYCTPCHSTMAFGDHNIASSTVSIGYADSQLASYYLPGETKGAATLARIQDGSMPQGAGCTGDPTLDAGNPACLTQEEQDAIEAWILDGQLP